MSNEYPYASMRDSFDLSAYLASWWGRRTAKAVR